MSGMRGWDERDDLGPLERGKWGFDSERGNHEDEDEEEGEGDGQPAVEEVSPAVIKRRATRVKKSLTAALDRLYQLQHCNLKDKKQRHDTE